MLSDETTEPLRAFHHAGPCLAATQAGKAILVQTASAR